jgi:putative heme transporter
MANVASAPPACGPAAQARHRRVKAAVRVAAIGAITAGTGFAVYAERATVASGLTAFTRANVGWVAAGFAAESLSMIAFALLQKRLLLPTRARLTFGSLMGIVYASTAISLAVPVAGSGLATAYTHRRFQASGADRAEVSMVLLIAGLISTVAFAVVIGAGAVVSGNPTASLTGLATSMLAVLAMGLLVTVLHWPRGRARLRGPVTLALRQVQRLTQWPRGDADTVVAGTLERFGAFSPSLSSILAAFACALVNWAADIVCLAAAIAAIGSPVPWGKLVLAWSAGQAAASLSPTPYGIGLVDVALIIALHAARLGTADAVAAVLYYRIITFKIGATLLWIGCTYLHNRLNRSARHRAVSPVSRLAQRGRL